MSSLITNRTVIGLFLIRVFSGPITDVLLGLAAALSADGAVDVVRDDRHPRLAAEPVRHDRQHRGRLPDRPVRQGDRLAGAGRRLAFTCAFGLSALSMFMPFVANDYAALALMGLALFGNQWVAATYIGLVGDVVPPALVGRVNGIAGFGDSASVLVAQLAIGVLVDRYSFTPVFIGAGIFPLLALCSVLLVVKGHRHQFQTA